MAMYVKSFHHETNILPGSKF